MRAAARYAPRMRRLLLAPLLLLGLLQNAGSFAAQPVKRPLRRSKSSARKTRKPISRRLPAPVDPTTGDNVDGDELSVRRAAVEALGTIPGSVVVVDPGSGRILTIVNQKLALTTAFIPCSTIKLITALAALTE